MELNIMVAVFVDLSNLYYTVDKYFNGRRLSYSYYLKRATGGEKLIKAVAYGSKIGEQADRFIGMLSAFGFETKYKEVKTIIRGDRIIHKADWDVGISMDVVDFLSNHNVDRIVLGSADSDMAPLVKWIINQGVKCHILAANISYELKAVATSWEEINESFLIPKQNRLPYIKDFHNEINQTTK